MKGFAGCWTALSILVHHAATVAALRVNNLNVIMAQSKNEAEWATVTQERLEFFSKVKEGAYKKIGSTLGELVDMAERGEENLSEQYSELLFAKGQVAVDVVFTQRDLVDGETYLPSDFEALGFRMVTCNKNVCTGFADIESLVKLSHHQQVQAMMHVMKPLTNAGSVVSEGDQSMRTDRVKEVFGLTGEGQTIGVLSDSFDCLQSNTNVRYSTDLLTQDLPPGITVIVDFTEAGCVDEGRAMMQLIHDVAPDAKLQFWAALIAGPTMFAEGIVAMARAGSTVILDDISWFAEPWFQDGVIPQTIDLVAGRGVNAFGGPVPYFTAAGNSARRAWHTEGFVSSGVSFGGGVAHNFGTNDAVDFVQGFTALPGTTILILQWDQPFASVPGSASCQSDVDFYITDPTGSEILASSTMFNIGGNAVEGFIFTISEQIDLGIVITLFSGAPPRYMKWWYPIGRLTNIEYAVFSSTIMSNNNARLAASIGAARFSNTPPFGVDPAIQESFSSAGGSPIFFDNAGNRLSTPEVRLKPNVVGPDGTLTTFFPPREGGGNRFFGTSAASPHVGAIAALIRQADMNLEPEDIYDILERTALDMDDTATPDFDFGFDFGTGYGYVDALAALVSIIPTPAPTPVPTPYPSPSPTDAPTTLSPTAQGPTPAPTYRRRGICFSGDSTVQVLGKGRVVMKDLEVNDMVFVGSVGPKHIYQPIYAFGHLDLTSPTEYLRIHTNATGSGALEISAAHLVYTTTEDHPVRADSLQAGDILWWETIDSRAAPALVASVDTVVKSGAFMPLTRDGALIVNGIRASSYVSIRDDAPSVVSRYLRVLSSEDRLLHWWLAPYRMVCIGLSSNLCKDDYNEEGIANWLVIGHFVATVGDGWWSGFQFLGLVLVGIFMTVCMAMESLVGFLGSVPGAVCICTLAIVASRSVGWREKKGQKVKYA